MSAVRVLAGAVATAVLAAATAGCTGSQDEASPSPSPSTASPSASDPPARLDLAVYGDKRRVQAYRRIVRAYATQNQGVDLRLTAYPDAASAAREIGTALDGGSGPDVFLLDQGYLPRYVAKGRLQPLDHLLEDRGLQFGDDYQRVALTAFSAEAGLQCMPAETSPLVVYYNRGLLPRSQLRAAEVELPKGEEGSWSWEDFAATARAIAGRDQTGPIKGVSIPADLDTLTAFVRSAGGEVVDDVNNPTTLTLATDEALATINEVASLARDPIVSLTKADLATKPALDWFVDGKLGMYIGTRNDLPRLRSQKGLEFDVYPLPSFGRSRSVSMMNGYCIAAGSDVTDAAADFVAFAVGPEASEIAAASGEIVPSNVDMVHSNAFIQPRKQPRHSQVYLSGIRRSDPLPFSSAWLEMRSQVAKVLEELYSRLDLVLDAALEPRMTRLDQRSESMFAAAAGADEG